MSYVVHNFRNGEVIEAPPVNEMDEQIQKNEREIGTFNTKIESKQDAPENTGEAGMVLGLDSNLEPAWMDVDIHIDPEEVEPIVTEWLDEHPEATTTVQDGSITRAKLNSALQNTIDSKYEMPAGGIPASDIANGVIPDVDDIVAVQDTQPSSEETKIWIAETAPTPVQVPTYAEFEEAIEVTSALVIVSDTQPSQETNKLWIEEDAEEEYILPTTTELQTAIDTRIAKPESANSGDFLCYNGTTWVATTIPSANGVSF